MFDTIWHNLLEMKRQTEATVKITNEVKKRAMKESFKEVKIFPAALGNKAGWLGSAVLAYHQYYLNK